ncbi:diguanylate cyclase [Rhodobacter ferrooxidans]|uniref:diguanylate cyclase n=1 Tax=Rhodobacter ferrooxidans TaxID=371731 RepID=C8S055_9RHOB|nr:diguanylate cyclase [Rhodobacter sp. SW2]EEW25664.1 response regulator receiver modulated diguanylate cyclase [Rhodobacter sp. SW2]
MVGKILIVDDVATNRIVFKVKLGAACYQPILAADGESCLRLAHEAAPDLILLDLMLPDLTGIEVLTRLRADPVTCDIPVVMISASQDEDARLAALAAGADDFLTKPIDDLLLLARLRNLLRAREAVTELGPRGTHLHALGLAEGRADFVGPGCVALVAERTETGMRWRKDLTGVLHDSVLVLSREAALVEGGNGAAPDVFVIDADLGGPGGGLRLMSELRSRAATKHAAICIVRPVVSVESTAMAYDLGANDVFSSAVPPREMALRLRTLLRRKRLADTMRASVQDGLRLAVIDPLTGLYNRRYALPQLAAIAERAQEAGQGFAVMVIDLDRFKAVNDHWGHAAGDAVLVEVAERLTENLRKTDLLARIGGEEFLVVLPDSDLTDARATAERLCAVMQERPIQVQGGSLSVTVSIGLAISNPARQVEPVADIVDRADRALMLAKANGRNKVTISRSAA